MPRLLVLALLAVITCTSAERGFCDDLSEARDHYRKGIRAYELGQFDEAIREFSDAYRIKDDPVILFNIAQAHRLAGHSADALRTYRMYLMKVPSATNRPEVERLIAELTAKQEPKPEDPDTDRARRHFQQGLTYYEADSYDQAAKEFEEARRLKPLPAFDFNIGRTYDRLGNDALAIAAYERYIASMPTPPDAEDIRTRIAVLKTRQEGHVPNHEAGHEVAPTAKPAPAADMVPSMAPGRTKKIAGIATAVVGVVAVGTAVGLGVWAKQISDELDTDSQAGKFDRSKYDQGSGTQIGAAVVGAVGGAAVVVGSIVAILGARESRRSTRASVTPWFGTARAGGSLCVGF
jgi:outer membrane protein assembly factor BamD (BamD/ComL family)